MAMQKLFVIPTAAPVDAPGFVIYVAGPIELIGGWGVLLGFMTRKAAFLCSGLMAAAYWMAHGTKAVLLPTNGGELAALYCFVFLFISVHGAGEWSMDKAQGRA